MIYFIVQSIGSATILTSRVRVLNYLSKLFLIFFLTSMVLLASLRKLGVGPDDTNYNAVFETFSVWNNNQASVFDFNAYFMEFGFLQFNKITSFLGFGYVQVLFFLISAISLHSIWKFSSKYSTYPEVSIYLYYSHYFLLRDMNQLRVAVAFSVLCYILTYSPKIATEVKIFSTKTFAFVLAPAIFHLTAASALGAYFFCRYRKLSIFVATLVIFMSVIGISLGGFLENVPIVGERLKPYLESSYFLPIPFLTMSNVKYLFIFALVCYFTFRQKEVSLSKYNIVVGFFITGIFYRFLFLDVGILSARVSTFLLTFEIFIIPIILKSLTKKLRGLSMIGIILYGMINVYLNINFYNYVNEYEFAG